MATLNYPSNLCHMRRWKKVKLIADQILNSKSRYSNAKNKEA